MSKGAIMHDRNHPQKTAITGNIYDWWGRPDSDMYISFFIDSYHIPTSKLMIEVIKKNLQKITDVLK